MNISGSFLRKYFFILGMYTACGFDCFSDTHCIERSLVCDRYRNCPNGTDEANCEYSPYRVHKFIAKNRHILVLGHHHEPLSFRGKVILFAILMIIVSTAVSIIFGCYFCCKVNKNNNRLSFITRDRKSSMKAMRKTMFFFAN